MKPHQEVAQRVKAEVVSLKEKLKALRANGSEPEKTQKLEARIREEEKAARDAQAKVDAIDAGVFDLKAVNPNAVAKIDERTPEDVIQSIEHQATIAAQSLGALRKLLANSLDGAS